MSKQPLTLIAQCLHAINNIDQLKYAAGIEKIRDHMFRTFDETKQKLVLGESKTWNRDGELCEHVYYRDNIQYSEKYEWFADGTMFSVTQFCSGKLHGTFAAWYSTGDPRMIVQYKNGKRHGDYIDWNRDGEIWCHTIYEDDIVISEPKPYA